jgi:hypothetical protein
VFPLIPLKIGREDDKLTSTICWRLERKSVIRARELLSKP